MSSSADKFKEALAKRNQDKADEAARKAGGGSSGGYTDVPFTALGNFDRVFRFRGLPHLVRENGTDSKKIFFTLALKDDDKYARIIGPDPRSTEGKTWILHRVISTVLDYEWDPNLNGGKGDKVYKYQTSCPDIFNRIRKNNQLTNKYATGWQFSGAVMVNVIDRQAMDWHKEHKKCRVLSKGSWESGTGEDKKINFDLGVPEGLINTIIDDIVALDGNTNWEDYDIVAKRLPENPWYKAYHPRDDAKRISQEALAIATVNPLTKEEADWEMWDFDKLYPITKYKRIRECFGLTIQKIDKVFGKTFYEELMALVEEEEKEETARKAASGESDAKDAEASAEAPVEEKAAPAEEAKPAVRTREPATPASDALPWDKLTDGTLNGTKYLGVPQLTDKEKSLILGINPDGTFKFAPEAGELLQDTKTGEMMPEKIHVNLVTGRIYGPAE